jgi:phage terminase large subunit-like protein
MTLLSCWPCNDCAGPVDVVAGECIECGRVYREPQPGPQSDFITSEAEIRIYAGAMGTGKTYALLLDWLIKGAAVDGANGLVCRKNSADITIRGGLWDESKKVFARTGGHERGGANMDWEWSATGSTLSFRHLKEDSVTRKKGPGFSWVGIEEADECEMDTILWLLQRMRSAAGIRPMLAMTTNPNPFHPLRTWVDWYIEDRADGRGLLDPSKSGIVRYTMAHTATGRRVFADTAEQCASLAEGEPAGAMTYTVISSVLEDNAILEAADPNYRGKFSQMSPSERAKNLDADWNAKPETGGMLRKSRWTPVEAPLGPIVRRVRGWDKAGTRPSKVTPNPDFTAGPLMLWDDAGRFYLAGLEVCREEPAEVLRLQRNTAALDGPAVDQVSFTDPGAAGKEAAMSTRRNFESSPRCGRVSFYPTGNKLNQKVLNAQALSQALEQGRGYILVGPWMDQPYSDAGDAPSTIRALIESQLFVFVDPEAKDDIVDGVTVAFNHGDRGPQQPSPTDPRETIRQASAQLRQRLGLRGSGRRR